MLTLPQIRKMIFSAGYAQLIDRVLTNGRSGNLAIRLRLSHSARVEAAALGLALQRACELAYAPQPLHVDLAERIIELEGPDGCFVSGDALNHSSADEGVGIPGVPGIPGIPRAGALAVVVRGLLSYQSLRAQVGLPFDPVIEQTIDRAIEGFSRSQQPDGSISEDEVEDAIILWQLGRSERFRGAICWLAFHESVAEHAVAEGDPEVRRLALAAA